MLVLGCLYVISQCMLLFFNSLSKLLPPFLRTLKGPRNLLIPAFRFWSFYFFISFLIWTLPFQQLPIGLTFLLHHAAQPPHPFLAEFYRCVLDNYRCVLDNGCWKEARMWLVLMVIINVFEKYIVFFVIVIVNYCNVIYYTICCKSLKSDDIKY